MHSFPYPFSPSPVPTPVQFPQGMRGCPGHNTSTALIKLLTARVLFRYELAPSPSHAPPKFNESLMLPNTPVGMYFRVTKKVD